MRNRTALLVMVVTVAWVTSCSSDPPAPTSSASSSSAPEARGATSQGQTSTTGTGGDAPDVRPAVEPIGELSHGEMVTPDGRTRTYRLYRPTNPSADPPLVLALHGGTGNGDQFAQTSGYEGLAEANGFIVAFPDGTPTVLGPRNLVWNAGGCCAAAVRDGVDDVGFLNALVDELAASEGIDPARVLVTGHSNGAMMGLRLACESADRFAAVAVQAGAVFVDDCRPAKPVSVLDVHGDADENVPIGGGRGTKSVAGVDFPPIRDGLTALSAAANCPARDAPVVEPGRRPGTTTERWGPCPDGIDVSLLIVDGADHSWMDDASEITWAFLSAHRNAGGRPSKPGPIPPTTN